MDHSEGIIMIYQSKNDRTFIIITMKCHAYYRENHAYITSSSALTFFGSHVYNLIMIVINETAKLIAFNWNAVILVNPFYFWPHY